MHHARHAVRVESDFGIGYEKKELRTLRMNPSTDPYHSTVDPSWRRAPTFTTTSYLPTTLRRYSIGR